MMNRNHLWSFDFISVLGSGDLAMLTWQNLGPGNTEPYYTSCKTQRNIIVPLANALRAALAL
jgi:hypothetical protein